jgi:hypothetical protein
VKRHRTIITTTVLVALICAAAPQAALAGSLLSGYGGPGEGSQALIGAALVKGPRGGSGGGSSNGSGGGRPDLAAPTTSTSSTDASRTPAGGSSPAQRGSRTVSGSSGAGSRGSGGSARGSTHAGSSAGQSAQSAARAEFASYPRSESVASEPSTVAFGVSGADLAYILAALLGVLLTAFATLRLARRSAAGGVGAKGISPSIRGHQ